MASSHWNVVVLACVLVQGPCPRLGDVCLVPTIVCSGNIKSGIVGLCFLAPQNVHNPLCLSAPWQYAAHHQARFLEGHAALPTTAVGVSEPVSVLTDVACTVGGVTAVLNPTPATEPQRAAASAAAARAAGVTSTSAPAQPSSAAPAAGSSAAAPAGIQLKKVIISIHAQPCVALHSCLQTSLCQVCRACNTSW